MTDPLSEPHSRNLRQHRQMEGPGTFFVTKCLQPRQPVINNSVASGICSALCFYAEKNLIALAAFVVMFDHWHALLATWDGMTISKRMKLLDRWIGKQTEALLLASGSTWQDGFHDTRIRSAKQFPLFVATSKRTPFGQVWSRALQTGSGRRLTHATRDL